MNKATLKSPLIGVNVGSERCDESRAGSKVDRVDGVMNKQLLVAAMKFKTRKFRQHETICCGFLESANAAKTTTSAYHLRKPLN